MSNFLLNMVAIFAQIVPAQLFTGSTLSDAAVGSYIKTDANYTSGTYTKHSLAMWFKIGATGDRLWFRGADNASTIMYDFRRGSGTSLQFAFCQSGATCDIFETSVNVQNSAWHLVVVAMDLAINSTKIYIDGVEDTSKSTLLDSSFTSFGGLTVNSSFAALPAGNGRAAMNVAMAGEWNNKELTSADVTALYNGGAGLIMNDPSISKVIDHMWRFGNAPNDAFPSIKDQIGTAHMTALGTTSFDVGDYPI